MIRRASRSDLAAITSIAVAECAKERYAQRSGIPDDVDSLMLMTRVHLMDRSRCIFVDAGENNVISGVIAGVVSSYPSNFSALCAQETLCVGRDIEGLRAAFDEWAKSMGASVSMIPCFTVTSDERFRRIA